MNDERKVDFEQYYKKYEAGSYIYKEGEIAKFAYVLIGGEIAIFRHGQHIANINCEQIFGETSLMQGSSMYRETCRAYDDCLLIEIPKESLRQMLTHPEMSIVINRTLAQKIDELTKNMADMQQQMEERHSLEIEVSKIEQIKEFLKSTSGKDLNASDVISAINEIIEENKSLKELVTEFIMTNK